MNTLLIYDDRGTIFFQGSGDVEAPIGLQHMYVEIPEKKYAKQVDTESVPHVVIFEDVPKSQMEIELELVKSDGEMLKLMVADLGLMVGGGL